MIIYGRDTSAAARAASIMMNLGVKDVRLLDGGWTIWQQTDSPQQALINYKQPQNTFGTERSNKTVIIDTKEVKTLLKDKNKNSLVSIRSWQEYIGNTSGYSYIDPKGRIAGAKWGHAGSDPYHLEDFRNVDGTMRSSQQIIKMWQQWGINSKQNVSFFCGTGWRASEAFFYAYVMGWQNISVYDGGWYEWSSIKENKVETGIPSKAVQYSEVD
ncbi:hypothetical protein L0B53_00380 [Vibrio sp. SS-MA-C1-2]|uniref:sulfurtransferase n=1 Tax=Vibrio sp. SS-MA-C1-2 TaxID=2908646 RepID=UPI001F284AF8|nr:hypothetical protein L0B53_00380 [Vibrio sp. SS-MA-C1-2]